MPSARAHKVALIGVDAGSEKSESTRWDCVAWESKSSAINLHDYDTWVMFLPTVPAQAVHQDTICALLDIDYVYEALNSGTRILVVGDATRNISFYSGGTRPFLHWTGYDFDWHLVGGDTKEITRWAEIFRLNGYLDKVTRWEYALKGVQKSAALAFSSIVRNAEYGEEVHLLRLGLAQTRNGELISFALKLQQWYRDGRGTKDSESIVFIPFGQLEPIEALHLVLKDTLGISISQEPPPWTDEIIAPGQEVADAAIHEIEAAISHHEANLEIRRGERTALRRCLEVLYQMGTPLESAVKQMLRELGGIVEEPLAKGHSDCYLFVHLDGVDLKAVVEIKGTSKSQFDMKGFRQLLQWRDEATLERDEEFRPIFIGNSDVETKPDVRTDPFGSEWKKQTKRFKVTALTTLTLYKAYVALMNGELDTKQFWKAIFSTDGVFELDNSLSASPPK